MPRQSKLSYVLVVNKSCINDIPLYILYVHAYVGCFVRTLILKFHLFNKTSCDIVNYDDIDLNRFTDILTISTIAHPDGLIGSFCVLDVLVRKYYFIDN